MRFSFAIIVGALAAIANAKAAFTNSDFSVVAGKPFTLTWTNATGAVTIELVNGPSTNLKPVGAALASGLTSSTFTWTPPSSLPSDTYAFRITDTTGEPNFSAQFTFQGSASASVTSTTASSTAKSSSSATTTSSSSSSTITTSASINSTTTSKTSSTSTSATRSATTTPANSNNGKQLSSSLALVLVTVAALVCFN